MDAESYEKVSWGAELNKSKHTGAAKLRRYLMCNDSGLVMVNNLILLLCSLVVMQAQSEEVSVKNCTSSIGMLDYQRDISQAIFHEETSLKSIARNQLIAHGIEVQRVANLDLAYSGPDSDYVPRLVELLNKPAGMSEELKCMLSLSNEGDTVLRFSDDEPTVFRSGYGLFRNGKLIGYFYDMLAVE